MHTCYCNVDGTFNTIFISEHITAHKHAGHQNSSILQMASFLWISKVQYFFLNFQFTPGHVSSVLKFSHSCVIYEASRALSAQRQPVASPHHCFKTTWTICVQVIFTFSHLSCATTQMTKQLTVQWQCSSPAIAQINVRAKLLLCVGFLSLHTSATGLASHTIPQCDQIKTYAASVLLVKKLV